jgi:hypothetical protein
MFGVTHKVGTGIVQLRYRKEPGAQRHGGTALNKRQGHKCSADRSEKKQRTEQSRATSRGQGGTRSSSVMVLWIQIQIQWFRT